MRRISVWLAGVLSVISLAACTSSVDTTLASNKPTSVEQLTSDVMSQEGMDWNDIADIDLTPLSHKSIEESAKIHSIKDPPQIPVVRYVPLNEISQVMVDCLAEQGIPATPIHNGVLLGDLPNSSDRTLGEKTNLAYYICDAKYPVDPKVLVPLPRVRAEMLYEHEVNMLKPCIEKLGYKVPEPPSKQVWLDNYYRKSTAGFFNPMQFVPDEEIQPIYSQCPGEPNNLYGD